MHAEVCPLRLSAGARNGAEQRRDSSSQAGPAAQRASMPQYVRTELRPGAFAVVWLEREPVNLMDLTMWQQLTAALEQLEADEVCAS